MDDYKPAHCRLAKFLYKRDVDCGEGCPLFEVGCPKIAAQDFGDEQAERVTDIIIEYLKGII